MNSLRLSTVIIFLMISCSISKTKDVKFNYTGLQLQKIPDSVLNNVNITELNFSPGYALISPLGNYEAENANHLVHLPDGICNLKRLKVLDLSFNEITELPDCFHKLKTLQRLDLSFNYNLNFNNALNQLINLKNLKYLNLYGIPAAMKDSIRIRQLFGNRVNLILTTQDMEARY
jgi:Leucine-rich repeat (LRR) protein